MPSFLPTIAKFWKDEKPTWCQFCLSSVFRQQSNIQHFQYYLPDNERRTMRLVIEKDFCTKRRPCLIAFSKKGKAAKRKKTKDCIYIIPFYCHGILVL